MTSVTVGELKRNKFIWEVDIRSFSNKSVGDKLESPKFSSSTLKGHHNHWKLVLYPKGYKKEFEGYLSLFLVNLDKSEVTATFFLSLLFQDHANHFGIVENHSFNELTDFGFSKFAKESLIMEPKNKFINDDKISIFCKMIIKEKVSKIKVEPGYYQNTSREKEFDSFERLFINKDFSDVTVNLTAEKKSFKLHKCILSTRSTVFETIFKNMKDKNQAIVQIKDVKYDILQELFRFIYTGKINEAKESMGELLSAAEKYSVDGLKELCENSLCNDLAIYNVIDSYNLAVMNNAEKLRVASLSFMSLHLEILILKPEFSRLKKEVLIDVVKKSIFKHL